MSQTRCAFVTILGRVAVTSTWCDEMLAFASCAVTLAAAFVPGSPGLLRAPSTQPLAVVAMAKGFGPPKEAPKKKAAPKPKSQGAVKRDKAAEDFEALKRNGSPEYMVSIREVPEGGEPSKWYPVGGMAVPRSSSIDVTLSLAIFQNEDDLLKGAFRSYPFLKQSVHKFECVPAPRTLVYDCCRRLSLSRLVPPRARSQVRLPAQGVPGRPHQDCRQGGERAVGQPARQLVQRARQRPQRRLRLGQPAQAQLSVRHVNDDVCVEKCSVQNTCGPLFGSHAPS